MTYTREQEQEALEGLAAAKANTLARIARTGEEPPESLVWLSDILASVIAERDALREMLNSHKCGEQAERAYRRVVKAEAERDRAVACIKAVRTARGNHPRCDVTREGGTPSCGWKATVQDIDQALADYDEEKADE